MKKLGTLIHTNSWDYKVYTVIMRDMSSSRVSVELYTVSPDGKMSDIITLPKQHIYTKKNCFDFFLDLDGDFARDDIDKIKMAVVNQIKDESGMESTQGKATMREIYLAVRQFIDLNKEELGDNPSAPVFVRGNFGYIHTGYMPEFVKQNNELGYKRLEILKRLKIMGALKNGGKRPYDIQVSVGGEKKWFYKIEMEEIVEEEEIEEEVIEI